MPAQAQHETKNGIAYEGKGCIERFIDAHIGGVGIAETGYRLMDEWLQATQTLLAECPCDDGCPSCWEPESKRHACFPNPLP